MTNKTIKRGDIYFAELMGIGSQQIGMRPVVIYSNNVNNRFSPVVNVVPLSRRMWFKITIYGNGRTNNNYQ